MYWHPLLLAVISAQTVALLLLLAAGLTSFRTTLHWQPATADHRQLTLEAAAETASILGRAAFWLFLFAAILLVFGIANVFHEDIPGAMCGTGVCQAMAGGSTRLLFISGTFLVVMGLWYEMDKLNRMYGFCTSALCRHQEILDYFGQILDKADCGACDVCLGLIEGIGCPAAGRCVAC